MSDAKLQRTATTARDDTPAVAGPSPDGHADVTRSTTLQANAAAQRAGVQPAPAHAEPSPLDVALAQFDRAADQLALPAGIRAVLRAPQRELTVRFPVVMDDDRIEVFTGYRVQHNVARGPAKGGIRYHPA